jgi:hypothetical protein
MTYEKLKGDFWIFKYCIPHCYICRPSDSTQRMLGPTEYTVTECQSFWPVVRIGSPHPLHRKRVCLPQDPTGGGHTLACGNGVGEPIQTKGQTLFTLYTNPFSLRGPNPTKSNSLSSFVTILIDCEDFCDYSYLKILGEKKGVPPPHKPFSSYCWFSV